SRRPVRLRRSPGSAHVGWPAGGRPSARTSRPLGRFGSPRVDGESPRGDEGATGRRCRRHHHRPHRLGSVAGGPIPELRSGGGTTPHTPRGSAYWRVGRVACVKAPGLSADRVGSRRVSPPTTYHSRPVTSDFRLPTSAF